MFPWLDYIAREVTENDRIPWCQNSIPVIQGDNLSFLSSYPCNVREVKLAIFADDVGIVFAGADADLAIFDPDLQWTITAAAQQSAVDYTPYEGLEVTGWPISTMVRGRSWSVTASSSAHATSSKSW